MSKSSFGGLALENADIINKLNMFRLKTTDLHNTIRY